jgi:hypothetical protein
MFRWSDVVPDDERQQWALDPFVSVGPLGFGMSPDEVSAALSRVTEESQSHRFHMARLETTPTVTQSEFRKFGLQLYCRQGVVIDVQRAGDHLITKPVFVPRESMDDLSHWLPREAWSLC